MMHAYRMLGRDLVQVVHVELAVVLHLRIVEEVSIDPKARRSLLSLGTELINDAGNRDKLDLKRVSNNDVVEHGVTARMIVAVDKSRHDRHLLRIKSPGTFAD